MLIFADENIPLVKEAFREFGEVITCSGRDMSREKLKDAEVLLVRSITKVNHELLEGTRVKFVATATIGTDHIDIDYLNKYGIGFASACGSNAASVAEYVMTALLCLANRIGFKLEGMTIGVIGAGNVGSRVVGMAEGLGMEVLENDPPLRRKTKDTRYKKIQDVINANIITLHVPLTYDGMEATFHMVNEKFLSGLRKDAIFINTSRGPVVETGALYGCIKKNKFQAVVLDVWENEPDIDRALLKSVDIATPHIAGYSFDGKVNGTSMIYKACAEFFGLKPAWKQRDFMPEAPIREIEITGTDAEDEKVIYNAVRRLYDIEKDDIALRKILGLRQKERGAYFDRLRREYPVRREFFNTAVKIRDNSEKLKDKFLSLGFKINCILISFWFILLTGCNRSENIKKIDLTKTQPLPMKNETPYIKIALIPEQNIQKMAGIYTPLAEYLSKKLGQETGLVYLDSYADACDKFFYKELSIAFFGSLSYAITRAKVGIEPIARPEFDGVSTYRGLIIVRRDSGIKTASDMKGKRLGLIHQATYAGYLYPIYYFRRHGIDRLEAYFSTVEFIGSHDQAIIDLFRGKIDVAAAKDLVYQRVVSENPAMERELEILAISPPVPSNTLCVRKDLPGGLKEELGKILLNLDKDSEGKTALSAIGADRFIKTTDEEYRYLYAMAGELGIDLYTYSYSKDL